MSLRFIVLLGIVAINGFFAAAEVALVSVRRSRLKELAEAGQVSAKLALELLANPERLLSVTQVGVTLASLGLGWAGEETLYNLFLGWFPVLAPAHQVYIRGVSFALAFLAMSFFHVVVGEVVPKNLAIEKADRLALLVAPVLVVFYRISAPFVYVVERSASAASRALGLRGHGGGGHSPEELRFIVEASRQHGHLETFEEDAIQKLIALKEIYTREVMTPRMGIVSVSVDASLDDVLRLTLEHKFTRLPVYDRKPEHIVGVIHYKDLIRSWRERRDAIDRHRPVAPFRLRRYLREPLVVPETKPLNQLVDEFRKHRTHLAMVVDEFGTITGLVTLRDVLEQIFGELRDEHDARRVRPAANADQIEIDGSTSILDLASVYGIELPGDAGFETLAGFLLFRLGYVPKPGDSVTHNQHTFTVLEMDRNRIARVKIVTAREAQESDHKTSRALS